MKLNNSNEVYRELNNEQMEKDFELWIARMESAQEVSTKVVTPLIQLYIDVCDHCGDEPEFVEIKNILKQLRTALNKI